MNDNLISSEFAEVIKAATGDSPFAAFRAACPNTAAAQAGATTSRPLLTISGQWKNYPSARLGTLALELRSRSGDQAADAAAETAHHAAFEALTVAFLGSLGGTRAETSAQRAAAFALVKAAVELAGKITLSFYGPAEGEFQSADFDGEDYVSTMRLNMAWSAVPQP